MSAKRARWGQLPAASPARTHRRTLLQTFPLPYALDDVCVILYAGNYQMPMSDTFVWIRELALCEDA